MTPAHIQANSECCFYCRFFITNPYNPPVPGQSITADCCRNPPVLRGSGSLGEYPLVYDHGWCGHFEKKSIATASDKTQTNGGLDISPTLPDDLLLSHMGLSYRTMTCLQLDNLKTIGDLRACTEAQLLRIPNFGRKSLNEIKAAVAKHAISPDDAAAIRLAKIMRLDSMSERDMKIILAFLERKTLRQIKDEHEICTETARCKITKFTRYWKRVIEARTATKPLS